MGGESRAEKEKRRRIHRLKEENSLLTLNVKILLDMMTMLKMKGCEEEEEEEVGHQARERWEQRERSPPGGEGVKWAPDPPDAQRA